MTNAETMNELTKAYKEGKQIQVLVKDLSPHANLWMDINSPDFRFDFRNEVYRISPYQKTIRPMNIKEIFEWWKHTHNPKVVTKDGMAGYTVLGIDLDNEGQTITLSDDVLDGYENFTVEEFTSTFVWAEDNSPFTVVEQGV